MVTEMKWKPMDCGNCKHQFGIARPLTPICDSHILRWKCRARQTIINNNAYVYRMTNCWYFEKK